MNILYAVFKLMCILMGFVILFIFIIGLFQALSVLTKNKVKSNHNLKFKLLHKLYHLRRYRFLKIIDFAKWVLIDIFRGKIKNKLFGIWCFTGYFGQGKTLGAVTYAKNIQSEYKKLGKHVHIYTNFNMFNQDGKITKWEDLLNLPPLTIVIFDEIQSTFTSAKFKDFPIDLLWKITQCRKQQLCIFASSPVFSRMTIQLRENTDMVVTCSNFLNLDRWFSYRFYRSPDYERYQDNVLQLLRVKLRSVSFVPNDYDYKAYNTTEIVDRLDIESEDKRTVKTSSLEQKRIEDRIKKIELLLQKNKLA